MRGNVRVYGSCTAACELGLFLLAPAGSGVAHAAPVGPADRRPTPRCRSSSRPGRPSERDAQAALVFTGSHNISGAALRDNDEILIKVENPAISAACQDNFSTILARAKCSAPATC
ncbi:hypothetical protein AB0F52_16285 [Amycolatopsis sp. NPDC024027]|uniref:hypothetical protein n=1 Tax=Amycolatopsis sp. NPDC024027 TaxID=3154327 RepID=UPI0033FBF764